SLAFYYPSPPRSLPSFPTRRSSDLSALLRQSGLAGCVRRDGTVRLRLSCPPRFWPSGQAPSSRLCRHAGSHESDQPRCAHVVSRSEEHTSELQSRFDLVCRLLLEKK